MALTIAANIPQPDDFYEELIDAQRDLSEEEVQLMNAKLILLLANHVGDREVISEAIDLAAPARRDKPSLQ